MVSLFSWRHASEYLQCRPGICGRFIHFDMHSSVTYRCFIMWYRIQALLYFSNSYSWWFRGTFVKLNHQSTSDFFFFLANMKPQMLLVNLVWLQLTLNKLNDSIKRNTARLLGTVLSFKHFFSGTEWTPQYVDLHSAHLRRRRAEQLGSFASTPDYFASGADPGVWREEC